MQAVILSAGNSSRFYPLNSEHKVMTFLCGKPILEYTLSGLEKSGILDIILIVSPNSSIPSYFSDGSQMGLSITYVIQEKALGMGDALLKAKEHIAGDFLVLNASHVDVSEFLPSLLLAKKEASGVVLSYKREDTWKYGVLEHAGSKVLSIVEKPKKGKEPSQLCIAGIYILAQNFLSILSETPLKEHQFEEALSVFAKQNVLVHVESKIPYTTLKYPWDLFTIKDYLLSVQKSFISEKAEISKSAEIIGNVVVEEGAKIMEQAVVKGPGYVGKNVVIGNHAIVRDGTDLEEDSVVGARMEIKNTVLMKGATTHSGFIGDSIIGQNSKIAADFVTGNVRLDRGEISSIVKEEKIPTGLSSLGAIIGANTKIGIKSSTMPGVIIGNNVVVGPSTTVSKNISDNTKYFSKITEVVEKI